MTKERSHPSQLIVIILVVVNNFMSETISRHKDAFQLAI